LDYLTKSITKNVKFLRPKRKWKTKNERELEALLKKDKFYEFKYDLKYLANKKSFRLPMV